VKKVCLIVPAAGNGSRLGVDIPKFLLPIGNDVYVADKILSEFTFKTKTRIVISPWGKPYLEKYLKYRHPIKFSKQNISYIVQDTPLGMGDAVFRASIDIESSDITLVIWGDQALINPISVEKMYCELLKMEAKRISAFSVLLCECENPYVQYIYDDKNGELKDILETREGDTTDLIGMSDCGVFGFTSNNLLKDWQDFHNKSERGHLTGEINFLPFLKFLANKNNPRKFIPIIAIASDERVGINTSEEWDYVKKRVSKF
jgi:bifunctional UDP-N-acetylglucosamine pyrophosphorylase/glucosamine-1-phosphate N-acetyltransferase